MTFLDRARVVVNGNLGESISSALFIEVGTWRAGNTTNPYLLLAAGAGYTISSGIIRPVLRAEHPILGIVGAVIGGVIKYSLQEYAKTGNVTLFNSAVGAANQVSYEITLSNMGLGLFEGLLIGESGDLLLREYEKGKIDSYTVLSLAKDVMPIALTVYSLIKIYSAGAWAGNGVGFAVCGPVCGVIGSNIGGFLSAELGVLISEKIFWDTSKALSKAMETWDHSIYMLTDSLGSIGETSSNSIQEEL